MGLSQDEMRRIVGEFWKEYGTPYGDYIQGVGVTTIGLALEPLGERYWPRGEESGLEEVESLSDLCLSVSLLEKDIPEKMDSALPVEFLSSRVFYEKRPQARLF